MNTEPTRIEAELRDMRLTLEQLERRVGDLEKTARRRRSLHLAPTQTPRSPAGGAGPTKGRPLMR